MLVRLRPGVLGAVGRAGANGRVLVDAGGRQPAWSRARPQIPWLIWGASGVLTVLGLSLYLQNRTVPGTGQFFDPVMPGVALGFPGIGALIVSRRPRQPLGWLFCESVLVAVAFFAEQYAVFSLITEPGALPGGNLMAWLGTWVAAPGYLVMWTLVLVLFPDGHPPSPRWKPLLWAVAGLIVATMALAALATDNVNSPSVHNPVGLASYPRLGGAAQALCVLVFGPVCLLGLIGRYRRSAGPRRAQLRWFVLAATLAVLVPVAEVLLGVLAGILVPLGIYQALGLLTLLGLPAAVAVAIVRHGLYDLHFNVETVVSRVLVNLGLAGVAVLLYAGVVVVLDALIAGRAGLAPGLVGLAVAALACHRLRGRLQTAVDRLSYRKRHYDYDCLVALGQTLSSTLGPDAVLPAIVQTVASALRLPHVAVTAGHRGEVAASAAYGSSQDDSLVWPLVHQGEVVGRLAVSPRGRGQPVDATDRRLLDDLARQISVVAYALCLSAELQRSREHLVKAREEERRRLRRDLHDGLKPALGGVALGLDAVRNLLARDPATAEELVGRLKVEVENAAADIRRLVHDLRPPALDELGLVGALRQHAHRFSVSAGSLDVVVDAPNDLDGLAAAVEVAAYRIGQEALENVRKHSGAHHCRISLAVDEAELQIEVGDDGTGLATGHGIGVGLTAMRERAAELGGSCSVESATGEGTCVRARIPLSQR